MTRATYSPEDRAWLDAHPGLGIGEKPDPYRHDGHRDIGPRSAARS